MPFEKGREKTGGRRRGTPNKSSAELIKLCNEYKFEPFEILLKIAHGDMTGLETITEIPIDLRFQATKEICKYIYSRKKPEAEGSYLADLPVRTFAFPNPKRTE